MLSGMYDPCALMAAEQLRQMVCLDRHPAQHLLARWLPEQATVDPAALETFVRAVQPHASQHPRDPVRLDFDYSAASFEELKVCDACGKHNHFFDTLQNYDQEQDGKVSKPGIFLAGS